jgi:hypothetical protein
MIVNFRTTKAFLTRFMVLASILANVYAIIALNATEQSLAGCESYIEQIQDAQQQYVYLFGEQE